MKMFFASVAAIVPFLALLTTTPRQEGYVGSETCAQCHDEIAQIQSETNMARTWQSYGQGFFDENYSRETREGGFLHKVYASGGGLRYRIEGPDGRQIDLPVVGITGSNRIGIGFLIRVEEIADEKLWRPATLEARYMHGREGRLSLSPGHHIFNPTSIESALGRVLNPEFETKCVTCHGSPAHQPTGEAGVRCENCHGPGAGHLEALEGEGSDLAIRNPAKLPSPQVLEICGACHAGFNQSKQPRPVDLLISDQVRALRFSECYIQSGEAFSCIQCHNPHRNVQRKDPVYQETCLSCHAAEAAKAAPCPVNRESACTDCHMPEVMVGGLRLVDHWIRVHPETGKRDPALKPIPSKVPPRRLFLREIVTADRESAEQARRRVLEGAAFDDLARELSTAPTADAGGYLGELRTEQLATRLAEAVAKLGHGEVTPVLAAGAQFKLLQRMPRDFRFQAMALEEEASQAMRRGDLASATTLLEKAVRADPHFVRAINVLAVAQAQQGRLPKALELLNRAARQAPDDPDVCLLMARALGMAGRGQERLDWLSRAVALDPDGVAARLQLGGALFAARRWEEAARQFEAALRINPLSAPAYFNLAQTESQLGRGENAAKWLRIAQALEPKLKK